MATWKAGGELDVPFDTLQRLRVPAHSVDACAVGDAEVRATIALVRDRTGDRLILDPHTACGVAGALRYAPLQSPMGDGFPSQAVVAMACAHPVKFSGTVARALGLADGAAGVDAVLSQPGHQGAAGHRCVAAVGALLTGTGDDAAAGEERDALAERVLEKGEDWAPALRTLIEGITETRRRPASRL